MRALVAKYGEKDTGGWALYRVKEGVPTLVLQADESFTAPDGIRKAFVLLGFASAPLVLLGAVDLAGALWTYWALRAEGAA